LLDSLITSKTRMRLILKFFLNPENRAHLRGLSKEFNESSNAVRVELNRLAGAELLVASQEGRNIYYQANTKHMLYPEIHSIVRKYLGIDQLVEAIVKELGNLQLAFVTGDYAQGVDSGIIDLVVVGEVDKAYLQLLVDKTEDLINRRIRTLVIDFQEFKALQETLEIKQALMLWGDWKEYDPE